MIISISHPSIDSVAYEAVAIPPVDHIFTIDGRCFRVTGSSSIIKRSDRRSGRDVETEMRVFVEPVTT